ncbi:flagellar biosynthetic protein FliO [Piscirickettsia litoralis]|uniref:Flagellar protein n=1 Tax=Piscirickettsia litoralis TaxID=1891921 RepID=A0ABX3A0U1_9GAMM|nr:flagellar biosynthetic protein FliO [Piscirickettsia litoralis]ODN42090.1 flagellar biosynthetic protein FliO [Piscirickettsia litoralis]
MKKHITLLLFFALSAYSFASYAEPQTVLPQQPGFISSTAWQMLWSSLLVILLIIGLGFILKRLQQRGFNRQGDIEVIATLPIGSKERLVIVQVGKEQVLLGVTAQHIQTLHVLNECIQAKDTQSFHKLLDKVKPKLKGSVQ